MAKNDSKLKARDVEKFIERYRVTDGRKFRLKDHDADDTHGITSREEAEGYLQQGIEQLADMQDKLYAQDQWGVLLIFQAMDAAGKDGAIKHVMSGVNPQGCQVFSFKAPSAEELDHDFLWRTTRSLPERGRIGIFNRSYYEEVLVARVHPTILEKQKVPRRLVTKRVWKERFEDIAAFERYIARNGYAVAKFFLNVSKEEQQRRFLERLDRPEKNWKFSLGDAKERNYWDDYMTAYEDAIRNTASAQAPWYVVPADKKWFARLVVAAAIYDTMRRLDLAYPKVDDAKRQELEAARAALGAPPKTSADGNPGGKAGMGEADRKGKDKGKDKKKHKKDKGGKKGKKRYDTGDAGETPAAGAGAEAADTKKSK
jgi:PPK2 family polyphosphate:nucleotide phosphotransferase